MRNHTVLSLALLSLTAAAAPAQQTKVVPPGLDFVEGTNFFTYPFGFVDAAIQILYDAQRITTPGNVAVLTGMRFRADATVNTVAGFTKGYRVTAYVVPTTAAGMVPDPVANIGAATGQVLFDGMLTLPNLGPYQIDPPPFEIAIPLAVQNPPNPPAPFVYDSNLGNLLLLIETTDTLPVTGTSYRVDTMLIRDSSVEGRATDIDPAGCTNPAGASLSISVDGSQAIPGGVLNISMSSSSTGAFPTAFPTFGFMLNAIDLGLVGLTGCTLYHEVAVAFPIAENPGGGYPVTAVFIPPVATIEGSAVVVQAVGAGMTSFTETVTSNSVGARVGAMTPPVRRAMMATRFASGWSMGTAGEFVPVVQFEGTF